MFSPQQLEAWMREALAEARHALPYDVPVGALLLSSSGEQVLARAHNRREAEQNPLGHAELLAIEQGAKKLGSWRLSGCILVVTLEPCPMCTAALQQARIKTIIYGANDAMMGGCGSRLNVLLPQAGLPTVQILGGILEADCMALLQDFFRAKRQI